MYFTFTTRDYSTLRLVLVNRTRPSLSERCRSTYSVNFLSDEFTPSTTQRRFLSHTTHISSFSMTSTLNVSTPPSLSCPVVVSATHRPGQRLSRGVPKGKKTPEPGPSIVLVYISNTNLSTGIPHPSIPIRNPSSGDEILVCTLLS